METHEDRDGTQNAPPPPPETGRAARHRTRVVQIKAVREPPRVIPPSEIAAALHERGPDFRGPSARPAAKPQPSAEAERARRYRARQRGEDVPLRKPGPVGESREAWRRRALAAESALRRAESELRAIHALPVLKRQRRATRNVNVGWAAKLLMQRMGDGDGSDDNPDLRALLRDVVAAIEARHEHWPEA